MFSEAPHNNHTFSNSLMLEYSHQFTSEDEHQEELKSVKTEFIKVNREKMRDPEPCRIKHTEDTEQQTGCCLFFILH